MAEIDKRPLVSGIIIFLNAEKFIEEAIESVFAQIYDHWELLLVDDGSTDASTVIALKYTHEYPDKVRYLEHDNHQNRGMSATRNLGIHHAHGEYIAFLDADDVWLPQKLEQQVAALDAHPEVQMVCGSTQWWYSWTGKSQDVHLDSMREIAPKYDVVFQPPTLLKLLLQNKSRTPATCSFLARRSLFEITGGFEEAFRGMYEDQAFFAKVYLKAPIFILSECWDWYRQHPDNWSSLAEKSGQYYPGYLNPAHLNFLEWLAKYLIDQGIKDQELWDALHQLLWSYKHPVLYYLLRPQELFRLIGRRVLPVTVREWLWLQFKALHSNTGI